jgi:ribosomal-protein-alanine N-acetyltransferase
MTSIVSAVPGSAVVIQPATWRDLSAVRYLETVCFPRDAWPLWDILGVLTLPQVVRLKALADGRLVGFIAADVRPSQKVAWIATIGVLPDFRQRGIGSALLQACEARITLPRVRLNVRPSNQGAIRLYQRSGYHQVGLWPRYYQDGEDALIMEKELPSLHP